MNYDVIGDVHGCAGKLESLLVAMGYRRNGRDRPFVPPAGHQAIFVGDLIDRGPEQLQTLQMVKAMVDAGAAQIVMGNHEFNALAFHTERTTGPKEYCRPHSDKNINQHSAFLTQVQGAARTGYLEWFMTIPLWLDLADGIRVVHACWDPASIDYLQTTLDGSRLQSAEHITIASTKGEKLYTAIETVLKGPEISLTKYNQPAFKDKDGHTRTEARTRWWQRNTTLRGLAELAGNFTTIDNKPYPQLPESAVSADDVKSYSDELPVFYGHYWRQGAPEPQQDYTKYTACVDFSAVKGGKMTAYRWAGEREINPGNFIQV